MYNWYKTHMENPRHEPPPKKESLLDSIKGFCYFVYDFVQDCILMLRYAFKNPKGIAFMVIYVLIAAIFTTIAVVNYRPATRFNFMGTQLRLLSAQHGVLTMSYPNGDTITAKIFSHDHFIVYYQDRTFKVTSGPAGSAEMHTIFSDGRIEILPIFRTTANPDAPIMRGLTEYQEAELYLLRAVRRLYSNFIPVGRFIFFTIIGLGMIFVGLLIIALALRYFDKNKEPPSDWGEAYATTQFLIGSAMIGAALITIAFTIVINM